MKGLLNAYKKAAAIQEYFDANAITTSNYMPGTVKHEVSGNTTTGNLGQKIYVGSINKNNPSGTILIDAPGGIPEKFKEIYREGDNEFHEDLIEDTVDYKGAQMQQYITPGNNGEIGMLIPGTYTIKVSDTDENGKNNPMDSKRIASVLKSAGVLEKGGKYFFIDDTGTPQSFTSEKQIPGCIWLVMDKEGNTGVRNGTYPLNSPGSPITGAILYSSADTDISRIGGEFWDITARGEQDDAGDGAVKRVNFLLEKKDAYKMFPSHVEKK